MLSAVARCSVDVSLVEISLLLVGPPGWRPLLLGTSAGRRATMMIVDRRRRHAVLGARLDRRQWRRDVEDVQLVAAAENSSKYTCYTNNTNQFLLDKTRKTIDSTTKKKIVRCQSRTSATAAVAAAAAVDWAAICSLVEIARLATSTMLSCVARLAAHHYEEHAPADACGRHARPRSCRAPPTICPAPESASHAH